MRSAIRDARSRARALEGDLVRLLSRLVAVDSQSGRERRLAETLHRIHSRLGLRSRLFPCGKSANVAAWIGEGEPTLIFAGHLDTVPPNPGPWTHPPLQPTRVGDRLFGLGSSDMKASIAAATYALSLLRDDPPPGRVVTVWTADEERSGRGTRSFLHSALREGFLEPTRSACVVTEPTGLREVVLGSRGAIFVEVLVRGRGGHSSRPGVALSPIAACEEALAWARRTERLWRRRPEPPFPPATLTPTVLQAGRIGRHNQIPETARVLFDCRVAPTLAADDFAAVRAAAARLERRLVSHGYDVTLRYRHRRPGHRIASSHPLAETALSVLRRDLGRRRARFAVTPAANDACFFQQVGIDTLNKVGPGLPEEAHTVDESVRVRDLVDATAYYALLARAWLARSER